MTGGRVERDGEGDRRSPLRGRGGFPSKETRITGGVGQSGRSGGGEEVAGVVDHHMVYGVLGDAEVSEEGDDVTVDE